MRVGIFSDSHDRLDYIRKATSVIMAAECEHLICAGDIIAPFAARYFARVLPISAVFGNNDGEKEGLKLVIPTICEPPAFVEIDGRLVAIAHKRDQIKTLMEGTSIVVTGHTHRAEVKRENGLIFINPGEVCGYLYNEPSIAIWDTSTDKVDIVRL